MKFYSRRLVKHEDLNPAERLFGGRLLAWIDEEAAIYAACQLGTGRIVTKYISEINFLTPAHLGDVVEFGVQVAEMGTTSITLECQVRRKDDKKVIIGIDKIIFVSVDVKGRPIPHKIDQSSP